MACLRVRIPWTRSSFDIQLARKDIDSMRTLLSLSGWESKPFQASESRLQPSELHSVASGWASITIDFVEIHARSLADAHRQSLKNWLQIDLSES